MIYFGKKNIEIGFIFGLTFRKEYKTALYSQITKRYYKRIPHYFLSISLGKIAFYIGKNRFKRLKKDELYELDGIIYKMKPGL